MIIEWCHQHRTLLITIIILFVGGMSGSILLFTCEEDNIQKEEETILVDSMSPAIEEESKEEIKMEDQISDFPKVKVDIKGAVQNPNVYEVSTETRIYEVIELAGGTTNNAFTNNINLSKKVTDEMIIYIFTKEEFEKKTTCQIKNNYSSEITEEIGSKESIIEREQTLEEDIEKKFNLNTITEKQLETIPGIGVAKAKSIIEYRTEKHGFKSVEELKEITGIKDGIYEKIKDYFTI